jgi:hypothetical protein
LGVITFDIAALVLLPTGLAWQRTSVTPFLGHVFKREIYPHPASEMQRWQEALPADWTQHTDQ